MKVFDSFKANKKRIEQTEYVNVYSVKCDENDYTVVIPKKTANKCTVIHFVDNTVCWEQVPRFGRLCGRLYGESVPIYKFDGKIVNTLFVVKGAPGEDDGLDDGIFRSLKNYDKNSVNCMTYKKFKRL